MGILTCAVIAWAWHRRRAAQVDAECVAKLVQVVFTRLREQANDASRRSTSNQLPYVVPVRLRDEVMQHELAVSERRRIWESVERVVASNANVRTSLEETVDGDEVITWTWLGSL